MKNLEDLEIEIRKIVLPGTGRYPNLVVPNLHRDSVLGTTISIAREGTRPAHLKLCDTHNSTLVRLVPKLWYTCTGSR